MSLTPIPWQPDMFVHPDMLAKLTRASQLLGHNVTLSTTHAPDGTTLAGWRSYATLVYLWDGWRKRLPGFNSASNPDNGPRSHSRGVGADVYPYSTAVLNACRAAGIQVNAITGEPWHVQLANFASYPIIATNTGTAGGGGVPIAPAAPSTPERERDMPVFFDGNVIVWPNGYANSYDPQVFEAIKGFIRNQDDARFQWVRDTYVRESWAAVNFLAQRGAEAAAAATLAAIKASGFATAVDVNEADIAARVIAGMPKLPTSFTVTPTPAK